MSRGEPPSSTAGACPTPCRRLSCCATSVRLSPRTRVVARRQAPVAEPPVRACARPPADPIRTAIPSRTPQEVAPWPRHRRRARRAAHACSPVAPATRSARRTSAAGAPVASSPPRASSTPSCRWPACSGRPVRNQTGPGDRPARRRRGPLGRRADLPAGERAGHPGRAPAGLRPGLGHRPDRPRRGGPALVPARPARRHPPPGRGAAGQGRARPPAGRRRGRAGHPRRRPLPGRGASAASAWWVPTSPTPRCCAGSARAGGGRAPRPTVSSTGPPSSPSPSRPRTSSGAATQVRLKTTNEGLHRLRPGELADLLEDLRRDERRELLAALSPDEAADALEEMQPEDLEQLLRESDPVEAARLLAAMEPDEAVDALRDLPAGRAGRGAAPHPGRDGAGAARAARLRGGRGRRHHDDRAGHGQVRGEGEEGRRPPVRGARARRRPRCGGGRRRRRPPARRRHACSTSCSPCGPSTDTRMSALLGDEDVVTVSPHASADEVAGQLVEARRHSMVVVDDDGRPIGRILADDVLDALVPDQGPLPLSAPSVVKVQAPRRWLVYLAAAGPGLDRGGRRQRRRRHRHLLVGRGAVRLPHPLPDGADHRRLRRSSRRWWPAWPCTRARAWPRSSARSSTSASPPSPSPPSPSPTSG